MRTDDDDDGDEEEEEDYFFVETGTPKNNSIKFNGLLYKQTVTLLVYKQSVMSPIEARPSNIFLGLPILIWFILIGCFIIFLLILASLVFYFYFLPRHRKVLSQRNYVVEENGNNCIMSQSYFIENSMGVNETNQSQQNFECYQTTAIPNCSGNCANHQVIPETHKSLWAVNSFYDSNQDINDGQSSYRTRSLPSCSKKSRTVVDTVDDLEKLYDQVNFTKKRRNRMRNDNARIIARCRSQNLNPQGTLEGIVVYDERTAL